MGHAVCVCVFCSLGIFAIDNVDAKHQYALLKINTHSRGCFFANSINEPKPKCITLYVAISMYYAILIFLANHLRLCYLYSHHVNITTKQCVGTYFVIPACIWKIILYYSKKSHSVLLVFRKYILFLVRQE